jgi:hypothetical protein
MSQHDMNIANQGFPATRADLNNALAALASSSSGTSEPSTTYAGQMWNDTTNNLLKFRNDANDAWITFAKLDQATNEWEVRSSVFQAVDSAGIAFKTDDGTTRATLGDDGNWVFTGGATFSGALASSNIPSVGAFSNRNLIINGKFEVDQRLGGSSTAFSSGAAFVADRFDYYTDAGAIAVYSATHEISSDAPDGFSKSLKVTCSSGGSIPATGEVVFRQQIEGYNVSVLNYGSSSAESATVSFWIKASVTGDYGLQFIYYDGTNNQTYVSKYTVNSANIWEYKTVTIPPQTTNAFNDVTNGAGLVVYWDLGEGSTYSGTADTGWTTTYLNGLSGGVKLMENTGATWQITGVQLEVGDTATPFEHRSYGDELQRCQRYYQVAPQLATILPGRGSSATSITCSLPLATSMRSTPSIPSTLSSVVYSVSNFSSANATISAGSIGDTHFQISFGGFSAAVSDNRTGTVRLIADLPLDAEL